VAGRIELLTDEHVRAGFCSGESSLDDWLVRMALQQQRKNYARTRVLLADEEPGRILGYYALTPCQVDTEHMPAQRRLPRRVGGILFARLAVDRAAQGKGFGEILLADAIETTRAPHDGLECRPRQVSTHSSSSRVTALGRQPAIVPNRLLAVTVKSLA
jgi:GNAT superfamily N-acetyltransferase